MSKRNVSYIQQAEPTFLKQFKQKVGYKEGPGIDAKSAELERDDSGSDLEDERPTIVTLKKGDLSAEDVEQLRKENESLDSTENNEEDTKPALESGSGQIVFKKPTKRSISEDDNDLNVSSGKNSKSSKKKKISSKTKQINNKKLLSFDDED